jgi:2',3'-cyclic-nucleotide 2'-phosphodiesterase (5'-nucleotidase family)
MKRGISQSLIIVWLALSLASCRSFYALHSEPDRLETAGLSAVDDTILDIVDPYRAGLEAAMNEVLAELATDLVKSQPECNLGNHVAGIILEAAGKASDREVDFAVMNYGGLRVEAVRKGPLSVRDAYQIMPFDNFIVVTDLPGVVVRQLFDRIAAYGGWPVQDATYVIEQGKAADITIGGQVLEEEKTYAMAISDYLADGGDRLALLKAYPYYNTGILIREAIMDAWRAATEEGRSIDVRTDGRVTTR